ncbi:hypothetical protein AAFF_G00373390 [Aldrovandia affinis]|uniref:Uncharacterized protein n=1 Tax=Aldrovandia affinis TaxID=143900 RepID=A0AAD7WN28_9TELE|nr:hypothetical protein AAFF_G00373390 [Aldrovandia affinis]
MQTVAGRSRLCAGPEEDVQKLTYFFSEAHSQHFVCQAPGRLDTPRPKARLLSGVFKDDRLFRKDCKPNGARARKPRGRPSAEPLERRGEKLTTPFVVGGKKRIGKGIEPY